jgi:hypothetical protein
MHARTRRERGLPCVCTQTDLSRPPLVPVCLHMPTHRICSTLTRAATPLPAHTQCSEIWRLRLWQHRTSISACTLSAACLSPIAKRTHCLRSQADTACCVMRNAASRTAEIRSSERGRKLNAGSSSCLLSHQRNSTTIRGHLHGHD